jgi:hypothetical protein
MILRKVASVAVRGARNRWVRPTPAVTASDENALVQLAAFAPTFMPYGMHGIFCGRHSPETSSVYAHACVPPRLRPLPWDGRAFSS